MQHHDSILIISGTNRPGSSTLRVSRSIEQLYRESRIPAALFNLQDLPLEMFEPNAYKEKPPALVIIQERVVEAAGLHVVLPEYNGSFPGVLKYFIDLLKFPESFDRKPVAFVGVASGAWGGLRAVEQLQMVFGYRNAHLFPDRVFINDVAQKFSHDGTVSDAALSERLQKQVQGFGHFCGLFRGSKRSGS